MKKNIRNIILRIIEPAAKQDRLSKIYDVIVITSIGISIFPLLFKESYFIFNVFDTIAVIIFILDYFLRIITADIYLKKGKLSFILYPITPWAIIDLLSIIPFFGLLSPTFILLRLFRVIKIFRIFKGLRYSKNFEMISNVFKKNKDILITLIIVTVFYIFISALIIFNIEPETFNSFFDSIYWATTALTTVGYGDLYPISVAGKIVGMISSIFGIAIIALPSGVITAGFLQELSNKSSSK